MSLCDEPYEMKKGVRFRNVIGSSNDPKCEGLGWLKLYLKKTGQRPPLWCCACNANVATVGGHIVLGDGSQPSHADPHTENRRGGKRVFIAPICAECNGRDNEVFAAQYTVQILHLCAYFADENYNEGRLAAEYYENDDDDEKFERLLQQRCDEHEMMVRFMQEIGRGLLEEDAEILRNAPAAIPSQTSGMAFRTRSSGMSMTGTTSKPYREKGGYIYGDIEAYRIANRGW